MTKQELNKKLAKWAGFRPPHPNCGNPKHMMEPKDTPYAGCVPIPDFTTSLDTHFKWLVLKLVGFDYQYQIELRNVRDGWRIMLYGSTDNPYIPKRIEAMGETPALALCKAIEQLIDQEKGG